MVFSCSRCENLAAKYASVYPPTVLSGFTSHYKTRFPLSTVHYSPDLP